SGRITISTAQHGGSVEIQVADDGSGMSPEVLRRIYDPFFTTKSTPKQGQRKGTGLGLAVTYGIMQEHAGKIHVQSEVGEGTVFRLEFPAADAKPAHATETARAGKAVHV
ncbi:MAG: ATP-binding protein, partial [Acidobacteriota bacterium]|nr:ATP-binding protein [Acidobacteriota bacterium]